MCGVYGKRGKWGLRVAATLYEYVTVWLGNSVASIAKAYRKSCGQVLIHMLADTKSVDFQATRGSGAVDIYKGKYCHGAVDNSAAFRCFRCVLTAYNQGKRIAKTSVFWYVEGDFFVFPLARLYGETWCRETDPACNVGRGSVEQSYRIAVATKGKTAGFNFKLFRAAATVAYFKL